MVAFGDALEPDVGAGELRSTGGGGEVEGAGGGGGGGAGGGGGGGGSRLCGVDGAVRLWGDRGEESHDRLMWSHCLVKMYSPLLSHSADP